ncbi:MAG: hypothetical protein ACRDGE_12015 [Candidatus Limnocylindria bacterium]
MIVAWVLCTVAVMLALATLALLAAGQVTDGPDLWQLALGMLFLLVTPVVGALIVSRVPRNAVGWLFIVIAGAFAFGIMADSYMDFAVRAPELAPLPAWLVKWLGNWLSVPAFAGLALLALLFPDGRLPSRRWWPALVSFAAAVTGLVISGAFKPGSLAEGRLAPANPFGIAGAARELALLESVALGLMMLALLLGVAGLLARMRRSVGAERQQLKWFFYGVGLPAGLLLLASVLPWPTLSELAWELAIGSLGAIPIAAGIAILRYRLYDIDVLINRTLVYGALTATLGAAYVGSVLLLQTVLRPFTADNEIAVAVSTLAVVALFQPLRRRIQGAVDRRFYRSRYDAARTLDAFAERLRDEVDLDQLRTELSGVVGETMRPAHASVWLRGRSR